MGGTVSKQKQNKKSVHTNSSSLVHSTADNSIPAFTKSETTHASDGNQGLLDQEKGNIHTTFISAEMTSVNVEKAVETVSHTDTEIVNM
ncbi:hypothetical protein HDU79_008865, partial [Rhizoclosmatium sp. JEL0117]